MPPLSREDKLIKALEDFEGRNITAKEILKYMSRRWAKTGFKGPKSLGLFLRRYRFKRKEDKYIIEQDKIDKRKNISGEW